MQAFRDLDECFRSSNVCICYDWLIGWMVVLGFNATLTAKVISCRSVTHTCVSWLSHTSRPTNTTFFFQSHRLLCSHASAGVRDENTPERKFASTGYQTHNHKGTSPKRSPLSHPGGAVFSMKFSVSV